MAIFIFLLYNNKTYVSKVLNGVKMKYFFNHLFFVCLVCFLLFSCTQKNTKATPTPESANIAVLVGTTSEVIVDTKFPNATKLPFDPLNDAVVALLAGKADYVVSSYTNCKTFCRANSDELTILSDELAFEESSIAINKDSTQLLQDINRVLAQFEKDGTLATIIDNWMVEGNSPYKKTEIPVNKNGSVLKVAVSAEREPMCFVENNQIVGLDAELIQRIAYELGMYVEFYDMKFSAMIPSVSSGRTPIAISNITATDERRESVNFSTCYFKNKQVLLTLKTTANANSLSPKTANAANSASGNVQNEITLDSFADKRIGVVTGTIFDQIALER